MNSRNCTRRQFVRLASSAALCVAPSLLYGSRAFNRALGGFLAATSTPVTAVPVTISLWFKTSNLTDNQTLFGIVDPATGHAIYLIFRAANAGDPLCASTNGATFG